MLFPFLTIFILFLLTLTYFRNKAVHEEKENRDKFWDRENQANQTRRQDISGLPYIEIPLDSLPLGICTTDYCKKLEEQLTDLSGRKVLNLSSFSNTDLKLTYGAANLPFLTECDQNFTQLSNLLYSYGKALEDNGFCKEAICILEYGVSIKCDMSRLFLLLASLYKKENEPEKIKSLIEKASDLSPLLRDSTIKQLETYL